MTVVKKDSEKMKRLAQEGKQISKIQKEDFREYSYWDIYILKYMALANEVQEVLKE